MSVERTDTVKSSPLKIQDKEGIPYNQQRLLLGSTVLRNENKLSDYSIRVKSTFRLQVPAARVLIKRLDGRTITLSVAWTDTIEDVKQKLEQAWKIPKYEQRLIFEGKELEDERTLLSYDITAESTLYFLQNLRGD